MLIKFKSLLWLMVFLSILWTISREKQLPSTKFCPEGQFIPDCMSNELPALLRQQLGIQVVSLY